MQAAPDEAFAIAPAEPGAWNPSPVARIMYASQSRVEGSVYAQMEQIRHCALRHNEPAGVATALLHQAGWFVQWKEGPGAAVQRIMERVAADGRHQSLRMVHSSRGPRLLHGPWSMAIVQCNDSPQDMQLRVMQLRREMRAGVQWSPPVAWRRLSTPLRQAGAARQAQPGAFQRVLVCSATGSASFELAHWLARQYRAELVQRRFAGAHELDVATDYVDFVPGEGEGAAESEPRILRLIAMARRGLQVPLTRAFLADYSHIVLLLSGEPEHDLALAQRVASACGGLVASPVLLGVAPAAAPAVHGSVFALARRCGLIYLDALAAVRDDAAACWKAIAPQLARWREAADSGWPVQPLRRVLREL